VYVVDTDSKEVRWLNVLGKGRDERMTGDYELVKSHDNTLVVKYSSYSRPTEVYGVVFKNTSCDSLDGLLADSNIVVKKIEGLEIDPKKEFEKELGDFLPTIKKETINLENGAEATFVYSSKFEGKRPMVLVIHGGPFGYGP
jgi:dipeptidyl aminopeptidase/acylaminoacyl peptidase